MKILKSFPPNYVVLVEHFPIKGRQGILYAWGNVIYNPSGIDVPPWLLAHETLHGTRQTWGSGDPEYWWNRYIANPLFRLDEEIPAHQVEYKTFAAHNGKKRTELYLTLLAQRLGGSLYDWIIDEDRARQAILGEDYSRYGLPLRDTGSGSGGTPRGYTG